MKKRILAMALLVSGAVSAADYHIVVHKDNPILGDEEDYRDELKILFLKQKVHWEHGEFAFPVMLQENTEASSLLRQNILDMGDRQWNQYWTRLKQLRGERKPLEMRSVRVMKRFIKGSKGAVGILPATELFPEDDLRVLFTLSTPNSPS